MHHGGSGTTHSVARAGKPQVVMPLIIDQPYWAYRAQQLGIGPKCIKINKVSDRELKEKVNEIRNEKSVDNFCDFIESVVMKNKNI